MSDKPAQGAVGVYRQPLDPLPGEPDRAEVLELIADILDASALRARLETPGVIIVDIGAVRYTLALQRVEAVP